MKLEWSSYKHFPYERELAFREARSLVGSNLTLADDGSVIANGGSVSSAQLLTYFSCVSDGSESYDTVQKRLEKSASFKERRQSTRYSVHGLHEYRGKFNPKFAEPL